MITLFIARFLFFFFVTAANIKLFCPKENQKSVSMLRILKCLPHYKKSKYYPYLHDLLAALAQRKTITATCKELRLNENSVQKYVHKILEYNGIIKQELINYEFE